MWSPNCIRKMRHGRGKQSGGKSTDFNDNNDNNSNNKCSELLKNKNMLLNVGSALFGQQ